VQSGPSAPTLNRAIARSLPPMPERGHAHGSRAPGGVVSALGHFGHDLVGWL
jgi:hypothetical protein